MDTLYCHVENNELSNFVPQRKRTASESCGAFLAQLLSSFYCFLENWAEAPAHKFFSKILLECIGGIKGCKRKKVPAHSILIKYL